jgi:hypothetical protein
MLVPKGVWSCVRRFMVFAGEPGGGSRGGGYSSRYEIKLRRLCPTRGHDTF